MIVRGEGRDVFMGIGRRREIGANEKTNVQKPNVGHPLKREEGVLKNRAGRRHFWSGCLVEVNLE